MKSFIEYWPVLVVVLQALGVWVCWSMRQMTKSDIKLETDKLAVEDRRLAADIDVLDTRTTKVEGRVDEHAKDILDLPTKADLARVEGEARGAYRESAAANAGIQRLEGHLIAKGMERT